MENALNSLGCPESGLDISNISFNSLESRIALVLGQICSAADGEIVKDPNAPAIIDKPVDKVATDKSGAAGHEVETECLPQDHLPTVTQVAANHDFESWLYAFNEVN